MVKVKTESGDIVDIPQEQIDFKKHKVMHTT